jgi:soluble lytic murein transglycosylase-like protein
MRNTRRKAAIAYKKKNPWWLVTLCTLVLLLIPSTKLLKYSAPVVKTSHNKETATIYDGHKPALIKAIIQIESSGRSHVVSSENAIGLMQVTPRTAKFLGLPHSSKELKDPYTNVYVGSRILSYYLKRSNGNLRVALAKYSGGARNYPDKVLRLYNIYKEEI